jgi:ribonuclease E
MANKMLIDATHPEETRVVVLRGNRVEEFDFETAHRKQLRGNIYLAKVTRVEPSLQAAFVDYGGNRHGFLAFSEIHPDYYQIPVADRQALLDEENRAERDHDEENSERGGRRRGRNRHRESRRRDETVHGEVPAAEGDALTADASFREGAEIAAGDVTSEASGEEPQKFLPPPSWESSPAVGETENPPVPAETAAENQAVEDQPTEFSAQPEPSSSDTAEQHLTWAESQAADETADEIVSAEIDNGYSEASDLDHHGADDDGNGAEDEEEIVESVGGADAMEEVPDRAPRYRRQYKIQEVIKRRQVMLVQVVKEERGTKGAALTTYLSLAGRYSVLMPNTARGGGISRKITSGEDRKRLREIADELEVPEGMGVILRTAGASRTKAEVKRDFEYLLRLWETVRDLTLRSTAPNLVYEEGSLAKRSIRDLYSKDIEEIVVAGEAGYKDAKQFMRMLMPTQAKSVKLYTDSQPVFTRYGIESQLDAMFTPTVQLRSGGYIVINQTEALVAIDVNSGRSTREHHIEDTALKTNVEAAEEIARQLRLRDLAGLIVIDFIDMDEKRNNRTVERRLKDALRNDRARIQVGRISHFGLLEMSRQRIRTSVLESSTEKCAHCGGTGHTRSVSSVALQLLRSLEETLLKGATHNQIVRTRPEIALYVLNHKRAHLRALEERFRIIITVEADETVGGQVSFAIDRGEQVMTLEQAKTLAAQQPALPQLVEDEDDADLEIEVEAEAEASEDTREPEELGEGLSAGEAQHSAAEGEQPEHDGAPRRRRRRRRGRGGEGQNRAPQEHAESAESAAPQEAAALADSDDQPDHQPDVPADTAVAAALPNGSGRPHGEFEGDGHRNDNGNGEHRRRRRGRRGGRRNRRDQDTQGFHEAGNGPNHAAESDEGSEQPETSAPDITTTTYAPRIENERPQPAASAPADAPSPAPAAAEAPRRRSTVREPAPVFTEGAHQAVPAPVTRSEPVASSSSEADEANKPRRTGWWARRLLGGGKS